MGTFTLIEIIGKTDFDLDFLFHGTKTVLRLSINACFYQGVRRSPLEISILHGISSANNLYFNLEPFDV